MWCVTGDLIAGECQVPGAETSTLNYNEEPAHLAPTTLQSPAAVMDPEMGQVTIGGQGDLSPAATLTTAAAGQQPTDKYFLEPINTLQQYPKPSKTTAADAHRKAWK